MALDPRLVDYRQDFKLLDGDKYEQFTFRGAAPVLIRADRHYSILVQSGYAVGWGVIPIAPGPMFPTQMVDVPETQRVMLDEIRWKTTWTYSMWVEQGSVTGFAAAMAWPQQGQIAFETPT